MRDADDVPIRPDSPQMQAITYRLFREYFALAERKRRWSIEKDIPWGQCNRALSPAIADVVQTFAAVELYLPDYLSKGIPEVRGHRGRAWFLANWGYEECKHSMALEDWLLKSGARSDEQMADLQRQVSADEWQMPHDNPRGTLIYMAFQELATRVNYTRLAEVVRLEGGCPALQKVLSLVATDEAAHADFFRRLVTLYLDYDREGTLEQMRQVLETFRMPALHLLAEGRKRVNDIQQMNIFNEEIFYSHVYQPIVTRWGVERRELRRKTRREVSSPSS